MIVESGLAILSEQLTSSAAAWDDKSAAEASRIFDQQFNQRLLELRAAVATTNTHSNSSSQDNSKSDSKALSVAMREIVELKINELGQHLEEKLEIVVMDKILASSEFNVGVGELLLVASS